MHKVEQTIENLVRNDILLCTSGLIYSITRNAESLPDCDAEPWEFWEAYDAEEDGMREVFEHWAVSSWLAEDLRAHGETVIDAWNLHIWCRTTTGQSITLDHVIQEIAKDIATR